MAAAIEKRPSARIVDELEVGAGFENFGEAAVGIDVGVDVDDFTGRLLKKTHRLRWALSPRVNVLPMYASARRFFARLASEVFLSSLQTSSLSRLGQRPLESHTGIEVSLTLS
jgi:hypothetical protein